MTNVIQAKGLTKCFGEIRAVDDMTLEVPEGTVFGFLGPNGSGKTTTIHLLLGLLRPTAGTAEVLGEDTMTGSAAIRQGSGALLEHTGLYERLSAQDNLEFYGRVWKIPPAERKERIRELMGHLSLWDRRNEPVGSWSKGMKQKLAIARALLHRPRLVFLDEPTSGLDPAASVAIREDIRSLAAQEQVTVFLTTHNLAEAEKMCGSVAVISHGRLLAVGSPDELKARAGKPQVTVSGRNFGERVRSSLLAMPQVAGIDADAGHLLIRLREDFPPSRLVDAIIANGGEVDEVQRNRASLEEVFIRLTEADA